eukprot:GILJ01007882.1.p1 GENE.GILJ01007882.1~~GILJ01007882.1.p1  ORF type:complete len:123 (+),score=8.06 GILJ01007882.1:130-498(+)
MMQNCLLITNRCYHLGYQKIHLYGNEDYTIPSLAGLRGSSLSSCCIGGGFFRCCFSGSCCLCGRLLHVIVEIGIQSRLFNVLAPICIKIIIQLLRRGLGVVELTPATSTSPSAWFVAIMSRA